MSDTVIRPLYYYLHQAVLENSLVCEPGKVKNLCSKE